MSKLLNPEDYGDMAIFLLSASFASVVPELISYEMLRKPRVSLSDMATYDWVARISFMPMAVLVLALVYMTNPTSLDFKDILFIIALPALIYFYLEHKICVQRAKLNRHLKQKFDARVEFAAYTISLLAVAIPAAYIGLGTYALILSYISASMLRVAFVCRATSRIPQTTLGTKELTVFMYKTKSEFVRVLMNRILGQTHVFVIGNDYGAVSLGNYNRSSYVVDQLANNLARPISSIVFRYSAIQSKKKIRSNLYAEILNLFICITGLLLVTLVNESATNLFLVFFGEQWHDAAAIFSIAIFMAPLRFSNKFSIQILKGIGASFFIFYVQMAAILLILSMSLIADNLLDFCWLLVVEMAIRKILLLIIIILKTFSKPDAV